MYSIHRHSDVKALRDRYSVNQAILIRGSIKPVFWGKRKKMSDNIIKHFHQTRHRSQRRLIRNRSMYIYACLMCCHCGGGQRSEEQLYNNGKLPWNAMEVWPNISKLYIYIVFFHRQKYN